MIRRVLKWVSLTAASTWMSACFVGCGGAAPAPRSAPTAAPAAIPFEVPSPAPSAERPRDSSAGVGHGKISRAALHAVLAAGLGAFLQHVELDSHPVTSGGKFVGFRIVALHDRDFWRDVDLQPGDVITRVNGFPIERPEQAATAFDSLDVASELRIDYQRNGETRTLVYAIVQGP